MPKDNELTNEDFETSVIELTDEDGETVRFDHIGTLEYEGETYVVLMPAEEEGQESGDDDEDGNIIILQVREGEEEDEYVGIDDDELLEAVFQRFLELSSEMDDEE